ncbi:MAG: ABC transporter substrate-binding protein [Candidatus Dormibacteria bacterium]
MTTRLIARVRALLTAGVLGTSLALTACGATTSVPVLKVGALFPLAGAQSSLGQEEFQGVEMARQFVNADGGVNGRQIVIDSRDLELPRDARARVDSLRNDGVSAVLGAYSSDLSMVASQAAAEDGLLYWEAGAVADQVTGRGLPLVFRVGASGSNLGDNSASFALTQLAPRLGIAPGQLTASLVVADDLYAHSVADAARAGLVAGGARVVSESDYNPQDPRFGAALDAVAAAHPTILILASHIPDGVAFRRAFLARHLRVQAFLGSTMAQCLPDFGDQLGADAVGVFASDRPGKSFTGQGLLPEGSAVYRRLTTAWRERHGTAPDEEALAGFSAAWALFHDVLPRAGGLSAGSIAAAARSANLPMGSLPNGGGLQFAGDPAHLGQNSRAAAVIWQWQAPRQSVVVWPPAYASGTVAMVPPPVS